MNSNLYVASKRWLSELCPPHLSSFFSVKHVEISADNIVAFHAAAGGEAEAQISIA